MSDAGEQILHTWTNGGWVMAALAMVAFTTYINAATLLIALHHRGLTKVTDEHLKSWIAEPAKAPAHLRPLIDYTQGDVHSLREIEGRFREVETAEVPDFDRRVAFLNIMVVSAPLFGLLGTVMGMLLTFKAIGIGGSSTSDIIARGIREALVATQTGMMVAIPGLMMTHVAKRWRNEYVAFITRLEGITLRHFRPRFSGEMTRFVSKPEAMAPRPTPADKKIMA